VTTQHSEAVKKVIEDIVIANRILAARGVVDAFGHVSARHPENPARFLLARSMAPELVTADDVLVFEADSEPVAGETRKPYLERFIHGEIYKARPDVNAVVHSHSPSVIPFGVSSVQLRPIYHMAGFLSGGAPVFDINDRFGCCTDMLVRNHDQGAELAKTLGNKNIALMRGHGFATVGATVPMAVYRAIYTETNAALQQQAIGLGGSVKYLGDEEALNADATNNGVIDKPWQLWRAQALKQLNAE
jgi:ribulose-5-phosphate 4-epimerase/fuculose-1-phosphate aldolase